MNFFFVPGERYFANGFSVFLLSFIQFMWNPFSHLLDLSHGFQTYGDDFSCSHSIDPRVVIEFERHSCPTMLAIRCLQTFSVVFHVLHFLYQNRYF